MKRSLTHRGFTLIELLIVLAIVGILTAVAIPNFLNAQIRSKVARIQAELKTVALALESYHIDHTRYPYYNHPLDAIIAYEHFLPFSLTTPVAYISSLPQDIFSINNPRSGDPNSHIKQPYYYFSADYSPSSVIGILSSAGVQASESKWILWSYGPDQTNNGGSPVYDPTNGLTSIGDIILFGP